MKTREELKRELEETRKKANTLVDQLYALNEKETITKIEEGISKIKVGDILVDYHYGYDGITGKVVHIITSVEKAEYQGPNCYKVASLGFEKDSKNLQIFNYTHMIDCKDHYLFRMPKAEEKDIKPIKTLMKRYLKKIGG